jgi:hypothetical protein
MKNILKIREPIWTSKSIGIAHKRTFADLTIYILTKDRYGNKVYPATYFIKKEDIIKHPISYCGKVKLYIVPIKNLKIKEK